MAFIDQRTRPATDRRAPDRLLAHSLALLVVLAALVPVVGVEAVFSADEGAAIVQARRVADDGTWTAAHPLPELDPELVDYPIHLATETVDGYHEMVRHPAYVRSLAALWPLGGSAALILLSVLATFVAAVFSALTARRLDPRSAVPTLWAVGVASPLFFDAYLVMAHATGAALAAVAAWCLIGRWSALWAAGGATAVFLLVQVRAEAVLLVAALVAVLLVSGWRRRGSGRVPAALVAAVAGGAGYVVDGWWTEALRGETTGTAGPVAGRFDGGLAGRVDGFERTWLWIDDGGLGAEEFFVLAGVGLLVASAVLVRRAASGRAVAACSLAGAALLGIRLLVDPSAVIPGLLFAFPLLPVGLVLLSRRHLDAGDGRGADLLAVSTLFALAVLATQHSVGGTSEWGGRYFALALPLVTPLLVMAVLDAAGSLDRSVGRRWLGAVVLASLVVPTLGLLGLRGVRSRTADLVDTVAAAMDEAGDDPVVLTSTPAMGRWSWSILDDGRWGLVDADRVGELAPALEAAGIDRFVYAGYEIEEELGVLAAERAVVARFSPAFDGRWTAVVIE